MNSNGVTFLQSYPLNYLLECEDYTAIRQMVTLQLLRCKRPGASHTVCATALKTYISIHYVIFSKYMLKHLLSVYESIMNVAPGVGLVGLCNRRVPRPRNVIFPALNQFANTQPTIFTQTPAVSYLFSTVNGNGCTLHHFTSPAHNSNSHGYDSRPSTSTY